MFNRLPPRPSAVSPSAVQSEESHSALTGTPRPENERFLTRMDARFAEFIDYATTCINQSQHSVQWYRRAYVRYRAYVAEGLPLDPTDFEARALAIEEWVRAMRRDGRVRDVSIATYWRGLKRFFKDVEQRDGHASPFQGLKQPGFRDAAPKALDGDACLRISEAARNYPWPSPHRDYKRSLGAAVVGLMLYAGLRRSEVVRLQLADVEEGTIRIVAGKGKFGGRDRAAYVSPDLRRVLHEYVRERGRVGVTAPELFVSLRGQRPFTLNLLRRLLERLSVAAGVKFSAHMLRHSFVSHLLHSGVPLHLTQRLAGHRSITTTMGYLRIFDADLASAIRELRFDPSAAAARPKRGRRGEAREPLWP